MALKQQLSSRDDLEEVLRTVFPLEAGERFCLFLPRTEASATSDGGRLQVEETEDGFELLVNALVYRADLEPDGGRRIEDIREQTVRLVPRTALPVDRERFVNYLTAVERYLGEQAFGALEQHFPSRWFNGDLLEITGLVSVEDFHRFLAASLPKPKESVVGPLALAFVLLAGSRLPDAKAVTEAHTSLGLKGPGGGQVRAQQNSDDMLELELENGARVVAMLIPVPIPDQEAEDAVQFSCARFVEKSGLQTQRAHLIVTLTSERETPIERQTTLVRVAAAFAVASDAIGVYLNRVTHTATFFIAQARADFAMMLITGVIVIDGGSGQRKLLSRGLTELGLPELVIKTRGRVASDVLGLFFELVAMLARRGEPLPARDTVGRDADEKLRVRYEPSPADVTEPVWSVDLDRVVD